MEQHTFTHTYILLTCTVLDYEVQSEYEFTLVASDMGLPIQLSGSTQVRVLVEDLNDNAPFFANETSLILVDLSEDLPVGSTVAQFHATDSDSGTNGEIRFLLSGDSSIPFSIDQLTGAVVLVHSLDFETEVEYNLVITASDQGSPQMTATAELLVDVIDVNDNQPVFSEMEEYVVMVPENLSVGSVVVQVSASDADNAPCKRERNILVPFPSMHALWFSS